MRDKKTMSALACLFMVASTWGADPLPASAQPVAPKIVASPAAPVTPQPAVMPGMPVPLDPGKFLFLDVTGVTGAITWEFSTAGIVSLLPESPAGAAVAEYYPGIKQGESTPQWHKSPSKSAVPCLGVKEGLVTVSAWGVTDGKAKKLAALTLQVGPAPPKPDDPDVKPVPVPVTSFRVIMVRETGKGLTTAQSSVFTGKQVEDWLIANTTPENGLAGFRRYDQSDAADTNHPKMAELWTTVKPQITTVPCWVVEVNGKAEIIPFPANVAEAMATLAKYKGAK